MSSLASWSYTAQATHWPKLSRDGWSGVETFGPPVVFLCDYKGKAERRVDAKGVEFVSSLIVYTERSSIAPGDRVLIGASSADDPLSVGAVAVRSVLRQADTFDRRADDFEVVA